MIEESLYKHERIFSLSEINTITSMKYIANRSSSLPHTAEIISRHAVASESKKNGMEWNEMRWNFNMHTTYYQCIINIQYSILYICVWCGVCVWFIWWNYYNFYRPFENNEVIDWFHLIILIYLMYYITMKTQKKKYSEIHCYPHFFNRLNWFS